MNSHKVLLLLVIVSMLSLSLFFASIKLTNAASIDHNNSAHDDDISIVMIPMLQPSIQITYTTFPLTVPEPGGVVTFTVSVHNTSITETVTISSLNDSTYGDLTNLSNPLISDTTCIMGEAITASSSYDCDFRATVSGNSGTFTTTVTATVTDETDNQIEENEDATVTITDVMPNITIRKDNDANNDLIFSDNEQSPVGDTNVTFMVVITNHTNEVLTIDSITDDTHNLLGSNCDALAGNPLDANQTLSCTFTGTIPDDDNLNEVNQVTVTVFDDENNSTDEDDTSVVTTPDIQPFIQVAYTAAPPTIPEPGGTVTFTVTVNNDSVIDPVTTSIISDTTYGNLTDPLNSLISNTTCMTGVTIPANGSPYKCSFQANVSGNANESKSSTATVLAEDDDNNEVTDQEPVSITLTDLPPSISISNTADPPSIPEPGGPVTFTLRITNTSPADLVTINSLIDSIHGNLNGQGNCSVPQNIIINGLYSCNFTVQVSGSVGFSETNTITANFKDDDSNTLEEIDDATVTITDPIQQVYYLPVIRKSAPTELSVWNDNTGGTITYTVLGTNPPVSCTVPNNQTLFCGEFQPGIYTVQVTTQTCGSGSGPRPFSSGPVTKSVRCP